MSMYQRAKRGIAELHRLTRQELGEGPRARAIRGGLDRPFLALSDGELARLAQFEDRLDRSRPVPWIAVSI